MVRKNSLASDFITKATFGLLGVCANAGKEGIAHAKTAAVINLK
jgi:hypothetical protein